MAIRLSRRALLLVDIPPKAVTLHMVVIQCRGGRGTAVSQFTVAIR